MTSDFPRTIIIDEPQSFLHPGAIRKLFEIMRQHPQHQYIITTHSPVAITTAEPENIIMVRKEGAESTVEAIDVSQTEQLRRYLLEIGASLSDVFGADNILWVEGPTEEICFPKILQEISKRPLRGTEILGVKHTGDLEGKHTKIILDVYNTLSKGKGILPPAVGFIFDPEGRSKTFQDDLIRQSKGIVHFLERRMFENYLLNPRALSWLMSKLEGFRDVPVTADEVEAWFETHGWDKKFIEITQKEEDKNREYWIRKVDSAKLLDALFNELSEHRYIYDKVAYSIELTNWVIENAPDELKELVVLLERVLGTRIPEVRTA